MKTKLLLAAMFVAAVAYAATPGDPRPFGVAGVLQCPDDGGTPVIPMRAGQNAVNVRNYIADGGTNGTIFLGFTTALTAANGYPLLAQEALGIDVVAISSGGTVTAPTNIDGGTTSTTNTITPTLRCTAAVQGGAQDLRYMLVK